MIFQHGSGIDSKIMEKGIFILLVFLGVLAVSKLLFALSTGLCSPLTGGALFTTTHSSKIQKILDSVLMKPGQIVYDLGCGDGRFLVSAYRRYGVRAIGYEINPLAYLLAKMRVWLTHSKVDIYYKDFWKVNLGDADIVFCYLFPDVMDRLREKLTQELKLGTQIISCNFAVPGWQPDKILKADHSIHIDPIYIYTFGI